MSTPVGPSPGRKALARRTWTDEDACMADDFEQDARDADPIGDHRELSRRECWELIRGEQYGRLALVGPDGPEIFPVNVVVDHATIVFRTAEGAKVDAIRADPRTSFEVDGTDDNGQVWSVVVKGTANEIDSGTDGIAATELGVTPWQEGPKPIFVRVVPTTVTGRRFDRVAQAAWRVDPAPPPRSSPPES